MKKLTFALLVLSTTNAFAHSGRTDASGCHTEKATGIYHCHNSKPVTPTYTPPVEIPTYTPPVYVPPPVYTPPTFDEPIETGYFFEYSRGYPDFNVLELRYEGFTLWVDCDKRGAIKFKYNAQYDTGNAKRVEQFALHDAVPEECQQTSAKSYGKGYDRGHLVPANHMDFSENAIKESNYMTNILPQAQNMNRGAWLATEEITECYRDIDDLTVIGGVIYGNNTKDDYFAKSHGVETPDSFWKIIIRSDGDAIAWNVPNKSTSTRANLNKYLITVADLEKLTGETFNASNKKKKLTKSWVLPVGCDKG